MSLSAYLRLLARFWALAVAVVLVAIGGSLVYSLNQQPQYQAASQILVSTPDASSPTDLAQSSTFLAQAVKTYAQVGTSAAVLNPVVSAARLNTSAETLAQSVTVTVVPDTSVMEIQVTLASPREAALVANGVASSLSTFVANLTPSGLSSAQPVKLTVVQPAVVPNRPTSPNIAANAILGGLFGIVLAVVLIAAVEALRGPASARRSAEVGGEPTTGGPFVGPAPHADPA